MNPDIVLSLFDGISALQVALGRTDIKFNKYYAAEIDKYPTQITQHNFPNTIQLGDVTKWHEWDIEWGRIGLISAGFPCQSWSISGKQLGDKDARGMLFWTMLDIISFVRKHNPNVKFIIENVKMKHCFEQYITHHTENALGNVCKILINSSKVSAQNRQRYYWSNFKTLQPFDMGICIRDILENGIVDSVYSELGNLKLHFDKYQEPLYFTAKNGKQVTIQPSDIYIPKSFYETRTEHGKQERKRLRRLHGKDTTPRCKLSKHYVVQLHEKANCLVTVDSFLNWVIDKDYYCRKLTLLECERLQTFPDNYTLVLDNHGKQLVSNSQRNKALGNSFTVDVFVHLLEQYKLGIPLSCSLDNFKEDEF